jgi:tetraacyldisaccharide 4'-kinase
VPVLVVGNLVVGGAGKTPTVIAVVQALRAPAGSPGVSRAATAGSDGRPPPCRPIRPAPEVGDEPLLIHRRTGVPVWVGPRPRGRGAACARHPEVDVLVADDGLQHHALRARRGAGVRRTRRGNGLLLPAGPAARAAAGAPVPRHAVLYNAAGPARRCPAHGRAAPGRRLAAGRLAPGASHRRPLASAAGAPSCWPPPAWPRRSASSACWRRRPAHRPPAAADHHAYATLPWPAGTPRRGGDREGRRQAAARRAGGDGPCGCWARLGLPEPPSWPRLQARPRPPTTPMSLDHRLIDLLVCPLCKGPLEMRATPSSGPTELACPADRLAFPIRDGIPVMLEHEARRWTTRRRRAPVPSRALQP